MMQVAEWNYCSLTSKSRSKRETLSLVISGFSRPMKPKSNRTACPGATKGSRRLRDKPILLESQNTFEVRGIIIKRASIPPMCLNFQLGYILHRNETNRHQTHQLSKTILLDRQSCALLDLNTLQWCRFGQGVMSEFCAILDYSFCLLGLRLGCFPVIFPCWHFCRWKHIDVDDF